MQSGLSAIDTLLPFTSGKEGLRKRPREPDDVADGERMIRRKEKSMQQFDDFEGLDVDLSLLEALEKDQAVVEALDLKGVKKLVLSFERKYKENLEARMKFMDQPEKFMDSEVDLDAEVKKLHALAAAPELYSEFVRLNAVPSLLGLLSHENTDIASDVVNLLYDLTDTDVIGEHEEEAMVLVDALVENNALELLVQNLSKLNETVSEEATAVHNTMGIIENMVEAKPEVAELVCERTRVLRWLLNRVKALEFDDNKLYASEILAILMQNSAANQRRLGQLNGVELLLQAVSRYIKRDPRTTVEEEMLENLFDALCCVIMPAENKDLFVKAEGVQLIRIIMQNKKLAYFSALKALDFALTRCPPACEVFVDVAGLKAIFAAFMGKIPKPKKGNKAVGGKRPLDEIEERVVSIVASLFVGLSKGSRRDRLLSKFVESEYEKIDRLMELYVRYKKKVAAEEQRQQRHEQEEDDLEMEEDEKYMMKLEAGLFTLQLLSLIFGHIWAADHPGIRRRLILLLQQQGIERSAVVSVLQEYCDNIGDVDGEDEKDKKKARTQKLIDQMAY